MNAPKKEEASNCKYKILCSFIHSDLIPKYFMIDNPLTLQTIFYLVKKNFN